MDTLRDRLERTAQYCDRWSGMDNADVMADALREGARMLREAAAELAARPTVAERLQSAREKLQARAEGWRDIASAPKGRYNVIDLWCVGDLDDIKFYCPDYYGVKDTTLWQGRVAAVSWRDDAWRPKSRLRLHALTVTPTHWLPLPPAPAQCRLCDKQQPCPEHGRTPITQADWDELHRDTALPPAPRDTPEPKDKS